MERGGALGIRDESVHEQQDERDLVLHGRQVHWCAAQHVPATPVSHSSSDVNGKLDGIEEVSVICILRT